jgi:hypothetical protein
LHIVRALKYIINYKLLIVVGFVFMNIYQMFSATTFEGLCCNGLPNLGQAQI